MKTENVIEVNDSGDESNAIQLEKQEKSSIKNDKSIHKIESNTSAKDDASTTVKTEKVEKPECKHSRETDASKQSSRPPKIAQVEPSISNNSNNQTAKCFERFGKRVFTVIPSNQMPTAPKPGNNQNASQHIDDVDMGHESFPDSGTPNGTNTSFLASNDLAGNQAEIISSVMNDHQYAKPQATTDLVDSSSAKANDNNNGESSKQEIGVEVSVKVEPTDNVDLTEQRTKSQNLIDLTSDQKEMAGDGQSDSDDQVQQTIQRQKVYNTRAGGNFKAGRWQKLASHSTAVCEDLECFGCINYSNERPHKCTTCAKRFVRKGALDRHMKIHENLFRCSICHIGLPDANSCQSHKYHCKFTRFECYLCEKYFCNNEEMFKHFERIHSGKQLRRSTRPTRFRSKFSFDLNEFPF